MIREDNTTTVQKGHAKFHHHSSTMFGTMHRFQYIIRQFFDSGGAGGE